MSNFLKLIISIIICQLPGIIGGVFTYKSVTGWYVTLNKPGFTPPGSIFAPVWITLYLLMGISMFLIWREGLQNKAVKSAIVIFIIQLVFNTLWSVVFFGMQSITGGLITIVILWILIIMCILKFRKISISAAYLQIPYLLWVTFASILNLFIFNLN